MAEERVEQEQLGGEQDPDQQDQDFEVELPQEGALAEELERSEFCRTAARANHRLLTWPSPNLIGSANLKTLGPNEQAICVVLQMWTGLCNVPRPPPVQWLRKEAGD